MAKAKDVTRPSYYLRKYDFSGGIEQGTNPFMIDDKKYPYLLNVTHDENGSFSKDGGYTLNLNSLSASTKGDGVFDYTNLTGTHLKLFAYNGSIYKESGSPLAWTAIGSASYTVSNKISCANFLNRCYIATPADNVFYTEGTAISTIAADNGSANIKGRYLEVLGTSLVVANMGTTYGTNQFVYSMPGTHVFYDVNEENHNTYATTSLVQTVSGYITGIKSFQGLLIVFTSDSMFTWNPSTFEKKLLCKTGCVANDTIKEIDGILYWASRDGVYKFDGTSLPSIISLPVTNWAVNSLWRLINGTNWPDLNAGVLDGNYYLWVGTMTVSLPGDSSALTNVVLVYDTYRDSWMALDNYPSRQMASIIDSSGNKRLIFCSNAKGNVYMKDFSYSHDGTAITSVIRTKYIDFDSVEAEKQLNNLYITYRPENVTSKYITVKVAVNGSNDYVTKLDANTDMRLLLSNDTSLEYQFERVTLSGTRGRSISYEFSNADNGVNITLLGFAQEFKYLQPNMNVSTV